MKFNETDEDKRMRLFRCLAALKSSGIGKPSPFVGMETGKAVSIDWSKSSEPPSDSDASASQRGDGAAIEIIKPGSRIDDEDDF